MLGHGGAARGAARTTSSARRRTFAQLNSIAVLFEFEIDETAKNMTIKFYEWK